MTIIQLLTKALTLSLLILISSITAAAAATFTVTNTADSGAGSLRQAVLDANAATSADTIVFDSGVFSSPRTITLATVIRIGVNANTVDTVTIIGPGAELLTISGNGTSGIFETGNNANDTTSISGMTLTMGGANGGGALANGGVTTLSDMVFTQNTSNFGGAISNGGNGTTTGVLNIIRCRFTDNHTTGTNINGDGGSALFSAGGNITISESSMSGGTTLGGGGAIRIRTGAVMQINNSVIENNRSGGAGNNDGGGAIYNDGAITITGSIIRNNTAGEGTDGGGIVNEGQLTLINTVVTGNTAGRNGGGIDNGATNTGDLLHITDSTISNNSTGAETSGAGGGIYAEAGAELIIARSTISGNSVGTAPGQARGQGGGIWSDGQVIMDSCTVSGNSGAFFGGVRVPHNFYDSTITNSTIVNNSGAGAGMSPCPLSCRMLTIGNTIIANNSPDISNGTADSHNQPIHSLGYNLVEDPQGSAGPGGIGGFGAPTDITGVDPNLGPLQNNGGPTETQALLTGSPAIDKGKRVSDLTTDQRGVTRPTDDPAIANADGGDGSDIGAYEIGASNGVAAKTLGNIATRLPVLTGENVLIGGIIVIGNVPKRVIIRALGPSVGAAGVSGTLEDPTLELFQGSTLLEANDNWVDSPNKQEIIDTGVAPPDDQEAAIVRTLEPGNYTAIVRGKSNTTGVALVDGYDLDQRPDSKLANISTRGFVGTGDNVLIAGFIAGPNTRAVVRGIGPSLAAAGINGPLEDPTLELVDAQGNVVRSNDNWKGIQREELESIGIQPSDDRESALIASLTAGNYTAVLRGKDNATGVGVVEVYNVQ